MPTDTKTALLDSAEKAARRRGFDGFSYADLAVDVGIRKASIHHHFPTKAALSVALMRRYRNQMEQAFGTFDAMHTSGAARLSALIEHYKSALHDGKSLCLCVSFSTSRESLSDDVITEMKDFRTMVIDWIAKTYKLGASDGTITAVADHRAEATATLSLLEGAQLAARAEEDLALFDTALALLRHRLKL